MAFLELSLLQALLYAGGGVGLNCLFRVQLVASSDTGMLPIISGCNGPFRVQLVASNAFSTAC
jgi:hypothetical protein